MKFILRRFLYKGNDVFSFICVLFWEKCRIGLEHLGDITDIYMCEANASHETNTTTNHGNTTMTNSINNNIVFSPFTITTGNVHVTELVRSLRCLHGLSKITVSGDTVEMTFDNEDHRRSICETLIRFENSGKVSDFSQSYTIG